MKAWSLIFTVIFAALLSAADVRDKPASDLAALQGTWRMWFAEDDHVVFEVREKSFSMIRRTADRQSEAWTGSLVLDETRSPKHLTWVGGKSATKALPDNICIYELHGDTLLLVGGGADSRPDRFFSGTGDGNKTWVLKREKLGM